MPPNNERGQFIIPSGHSRRTPPPIRANWLAEPARWDAASDAHSGRSIEPRAWLQTTLSIVAAPRGQNRLNSLFLAPKTCKTLYNIVIAAISH
jgi:hypothetical protein